MSVTLPNKFPVAKMAHKVGNSTLKYLLFVVNMAFLFGGIAFIVFGVVELAKYDVLIHILCSKHIVLIVFGTVLFIISLFGLSCVISESYYVTLAYSVFMLLAIIAQIVLIGLWFVNAIEFDEDGYPIETDDMNFSSVMLFQIIVSVGCLISACGLVNAIRKQQQQQKSMNTSYYETRKELMESHGV